MIKNLALALCLIVALVLARWGTGTPKPLPVTAPANEFSAGRAMVDDRVIARAPHPVGSPENAVVRDYLVQRMTAMGLNPQIQRTDAIQRTPRSDTPFVLGAMVENIVGVLPGKDRNAPALAIMAHYDSVPGSPGAADDAAGVSAALEILRILKAEGTPARDVILLITDAEEAGLLGAVGFWRDDPMAKHIGFVINLETRGGGGQAQMFQTGPDNGQVMALYRKATRDPVATSVTSYVYERMPNDTDFTVSKTAGVTGLNYAFIGRQFDYHSPTSTSDNLDQGSLQQMGANALDAARAVANAPALPGKASSMVYSSTFGGYLLAYPQLAGWGVLLGALALMAVGVWRATRRGVFAWTDVARGAGATLYLAVTAVALLRLARHATGAGFGFMEQRVLLAQAWRWELALLLLGLGLALYVAAAAGRGSSRIQAAVLAAVAGAATSAFGLDIVGLCLGGAGAVIALFTFGRPAGIAGAWTGVMATALLVATVAQVLAGPTAFLIAWPLTLAAAMGALSAQGDVRAGWMKLVLAAAAALGLGWLLVFGHGLYLGLDLAELLTAIIWLGALLVWPLAHGDDERAAGRMAALVLILAAFVVVALARWLPPWSVRHPQATVAILVQDLDTGKASRVANLPELTAWNRQALEADGGKLGKQTIPAFNRRPVWSAPAKPVAAAAPTLGLTRQADGSLLLSLVPPPGARSFALEIKSKSRLTESTVNGRPVPLFDKPDEWTRLRIEAMPQGVTVGFRAAAPGEIETRYVAVTERWPADAKPLPPRDAKSVAWGVTDALAVVGSKRFTW